MECLIKDMLRGQIFNMTLYCAMLRTNLPDRPRIPLAPVLSGASLRGRGKRQVRGPGSDAFWDASRGTAPNLTLTSVLDAGQVRLVTSGRVAIALALREMGVGPGDAVLVPAYHSPSMIPPVLQLGASPVFYRLRADTSVDLEDVASKLTPRVKVLMATHYFGFVQDLSLLRAFCDARGLLLLEDCAHCFFGEHAGLPVGAWGDYAAASSMKFFPAYEGGALVSARHGLERVALRPAGFPFEVKSALATLEKGFDYGRLPLLRALLAAPLWLKDAAWSRLKARRKAANGATEAAPAPSLAPASSDSSFDFDPRWLDKRSSWLSRLLVTRLPAARIVAERRRRYLKLEAALRGLPRARPLFAALPDTVCPWMFPMLADDPESLFDDVRTAGVPVTRFARPLWPGVDETVCATSSMLSRHVLAFPCHQELREDELDWMIATLRTMLQS
jgi:dTDP-4-amino-4,6-dideoxygalactose transaminase